MTTQELAKTIQEKPQLVGLKELVKKSAMALGQTLPQHMNPERVVRIALTTLNQNPELYKCTPESLMGSLFVLAQLGLEPIAGRAYLLPFNNKRKVGNEWKTIKEVQALVGYRGLIELFYRHESSLSIDMQRVHEKDEFSIEYGTNGFIKHVPNFKEKSEVIGFYVVAKLRGGGSIFRYMTKEECIEHGKKHSKTFNKETNDFYSSSPWAKEPEAMCLKTVLIQIAKVLPLSIELQRAISIDETSREYKEGVTDAMALPDTTNWEEAETKEEQK